MNNKKILYILLIAFIVLVYYLPLSISSANSAKPVSSATKNQTFAKADNSVGLILKTKGVVTKVYVKVGDTVKIGKPLVDLDKSSALAHLHQAEAALAFQNATLNLLKSGVKPNAVAATSIKRDKAAAVLEAAKSDMIQSLQDAYTKAEDAVKAKADQLFILPKNISTIQNIQNIQFSIQSQDLLTQADISSRRIALEGILSNWKASLDNLDSKSDLISAEAKGEANLNNVKVFMDKVSAVINSLVSDPAFTSLSLRNWRLDLMTGRTNINIALKSLETGLGKINQAQLDLDLQNLELNNESVPATDGQINLQKIKADAAQAQVELLRSQMRSLTLFSSLNGVVTKVLVKPKMVAGGSALVFIKPQ